MNRILQTCDFVSGHGLADQTRRPCPESRAGEWHAHESGATGSQVLRHDCRVETGEDTRLTGCDRVPLERLLTAAEHADVVRLHTMLQQVATDVLRLPDTRDQEIHLAHGPLQYALNKRSSKGCASGGEHCDRATNAAEGRAHAAYPRRISDALVEICRRDALQ